MKRLWKNRLQGVTLIEILVVSTILAILASISVPALQIIRQREKERRLLSILKHIKNVGIGEGVSNTYSEELTTGTKGHHGKSHHSTTYYYFGGIGFKNHIIRQIINTADPDDDWKNRALTEAENNHWWYPLNPGVLVNPQGITLTIPAAPDLAITIDQRMIRMIPPHPFADWYPNAHWEFRAKDDGAGNAGPWLTADPANWAAVRGDGKPFGVWGFRSVGAGFSINGENTDNWWLK
jgi:prepilin-type N-terminal cleavage/methylation domain-containing protein